MSLLLIPLAMLLLPILFLSFVLLVGLVKYTIRFRPDRDIANLIKEILYEW